MSPLGRLRSHASTIAIAACVALAVGHAWTRAWLSDDAFISFRYARNLVEGQGLVFNPGEHVEGYTNPLWTLFIALGLRLGASAEAWSTVWGIACYAVSIALVGVMHKRACAALEGPAWLAAVPFGAMYGAANVEWAMFATGGLETSLFTMLATLGLVLVVDEREGDGRGRVLGAGAVFALAALTRPDGAIFAALGLGYVAVRRGWRDGVRFALAFAVLWGPPTAWLVSYYGAFFPNTYYAKSADLSWWSQGLFYVGLYFRRHWLLALAPVLVALFGRRARPVAPLALVSFAFAFAYTACVARVGGDWMYARLVIPATPMLLVLLDVGVTLIARIAPAASVPAAALCVAAPLVTPLPLARDATDRFIGDVGPRYTAESWARVRERAHAIEPLFEGLPAVVAIYGDEVGLAYYARLRSPSRHMPNDFRKVPIRIPEGRRRRFHSGIAILRSFRPNFDGGGRVRALQLAPEGRAWIRVSAVSIARPRRRSDVRQNVRAAELEAGGFLVGVVTLGAGAIPLACSASPSENGGGVQGSNPTNPSGPGGDVGTVGLALTLPGGVLVSSVTYDLLNSSGTPVMLPNAPNPGTVNVSHSAAIAFQLGGVPAATGDSISLTASLTGGGTCQGSASGINITAAGKTTVTVLMLCSLPGQDGGSLFVNGTASYCGTWTSLSSTSSEVYVGESLVLTAGATGPNPSGLGYTWTMSNPIGAFGATAGGVGAQGQDEGVGPSDPMQFMCTAPGTTTITMVVDDGPIDAERARRTSTRRRPP